MNFKKAAAIASLALLGLSGHNLANAATPDPSACFVSMTNTLYEVWPGTRAIKAGRFENDQQHTFLYSSNINEIGSLCQSPGWTLSPPSDGYAHVFRVGESAFKGGLAVHRFRHNVIGSYLYTKNQAEIDSVSQRPAEWTYEGVAFFVPDVQVRFKVENDPETGIQWRMSNYPLACLDPNPLDPRKSCMAGPEKSTGLVPVYRFFSAQRGHYYVASQEEAYAVPQMEGNYRFEGIAFWAFDKNVLLSSPNLPAEMTGKWYKYRPYSGD